MAKYNDPFVGKTSFSLGSSANTIGIKQAGTVQFAANIANVGGNTPMTTRNLWAFLIDAPRFFEFSDSREELTAALKAIIENYSRTIQGLNQAITVEVAETPSGGSGERWQTPTNVTRATSAPVHGMAELQGRAIQKFIKYWITYGIGDENSKVPRIVADGVVKAADYDASFYGATVLYVETDPTGTDVVSAYMCTNVYPLGTGPWEGSKDAGVMGQQVDLSIEFAAMTDVSAGTIEFARELIQSLNVAGLNPNESPSAFEGVSADVQAADGLKEQLEKGANQRVTY